MPARLVVVSGAAVASLLLALSAASSEMVPVGVVTRLDGTATLTRAALPAGTLLKFRDPVYGADRITTGEASLARVLLGGKALVTVRERSVLTITETSNVSTVAVGSGRIAIAVVRDRMKPGEVIEIRTPNAVAAIRGTVVVTEVSPATSDAGATVHAFTTTITVLKGLVEVQQLDRLTQQATGAAYSVGALQSLQVTGSAPARAVQTITRERAHRLMQEFRPDPPQQAPATNASVIESQMRHAAATAGASTPAAPRAPAGPTIDVAPSANKWSKGSSGSHHGAATSLGAAVSHALSVFLGAAASPGASVSHGGSGFQGSSGNAGQGNSQNGAKGCKKKC